MAFDPSKFGATPVDTGGVGGADFNPATFGAKPLNEFETGGELNPANFLERRTQESEDITARSMSGEQTPFSTASQRIGNVLGTVGDIGGSVAEVTGLPWLTRKIADFLEPVSEKIGEVAGTGLRDFFGSDTAETVKSNLDLAIRHPLVQEIIKANTTPEVKRDFKALWDSLMGVGTIVAGKQVVTGTPKVISEVKQVIETRQIANLVRDTKALDTLTGTVTQGKTTDIMAAKRALSSVDTTGVKTYSDLANVLDEKITNISNKLDEGLATSKEVKKLPDLTLKSTVGEETVSHNYVRDALSQLKEYYIKTNDVPKAQAVSQLEAKAITQGLTVKELNDLAKVHGQDLSGFNASGELASGLSKQAAENTRTGVKSTAREMFDNPTFKVADKELSNLIKTRDLVSQVEEKVFELQRKVKTRTLGEKVGRMAGQVLNLLGANTPKGFIEYFLSRGTGLKTLNALDLESALSKNLKLLQGALKEGATEADVMNNLQQIINSAKS